MSLNGFFFRKRDYPPAEGTFDIAARVRVEPEAVAPSPEASATFTVTAIARVEPVGDIPPIPAAPTGNATECNISAPFEGGATSTDAEVEQTWINNDPSNTDALRLQEALDSGFTSGVVEQLVGGADSIFNWTNQKDGVTRYYRVRAENGSGESAWSNVVSQKHFEDAPGVPQNLTVESNTPTSVFLQWDAPVTGGSVGSYQMLLQSGAVTDIVAATQGVFTGLTEGTGYALAVLARGQDGQASEYTAYVYQATRHEEPVLTTCQINAFDNVLVIDDRAASNTSIKVFRNGALSDTIGQGDQQYNPSQNDGSWHVTAAGGTVTAPEGGGSIPVPESDKSQTRTMPFTGAPNCP